MKIIKTKLDFSQWLVIQSMKTREEMAEFVRAYSISQSNKFHTFQHEKSDEGMLQNVKKVQVREKNYHTIKN